MTADPMSYYGSAAMMMGNAHINNQASMKYSNSAYSHPAAASFSASASSSSSPASDSAINFTDYDDEFGNYYLRKSHRNNNNNNHNRANSNQRHHRIGSVRRADSESRDELLVNRDERETVDHEDSNNHLRLKRQVYQSSYENEPICYGFPLEVNIKSRIKMDQIFPIFGNSQFKKCIKVG